LDLNIKNFVFSSYKIKSYFFSSLNILNPLAFEGQAMLKEIFYWD